MLSPSGTYVRPEGDGVRDRQDAITIGDDQKPRSN
jgi:hypothetical protein